MSWRRLANQDSNWTQATDEQPFRAELFSIDQLEGHAKAIAASHTLSQRRTRDKLLPRLYENERVLIETHDLVTAAVNQNRRIEPAAEWLLDNFFVVAAAARDVRHDLPAAFFQRLPRVESVESTGQPRVYALATELVRWSAARLDAERMERFLAAFQSIAPLTMGELTVQEVLAALNE